MSAPVIKFKTVEKVDRIYRVLCVESHHGFPVVDHRSDEVGVFFVCLMSKKYILDKL
jgi:hypothetical protein